MSRRRHRTGRWLTSIEYSTPTTRVVETLEYAQPLIVHYTDGHVDFIEEEGYGGFPGHGERDAYGAVSLDDGATWKRTNLSKSGNLSSIKIGDGNLGCRTRAMSAAPLSPRTATRCWSPG